MSTASSHIDCVSDYLREFALNLQYGKVAYRGQADASWPLLPAAGRPDHFKTKPYNFDLEQFAKWRKEAVAFHNDLPSGDYECLAMAQHYGLATRLLDWTYNPLTALYFAVSQHAETDGAIYFFEEFDTFELNECEAAQGNPGCFLKELDMVLTLTPPPFDRRIHAQSGCFTIHPDCVGQRLADPIDKIGEMDICNISIPKQSKKTIQKELWTLGINRKSLFPGLEGLSKFINFESQ